MKKTINKSEAYRVVTYFLEPFGFENNAVFMTNIASDMYLAWSSITGKPAPFVQANETFWRYAVKSAECENVDELTHEQVYRIAYEFVKYFYDTNEHKPEELSAILKRMDEKEARVNTYWKVAWHRGQVDLNGMFLSQESFIEQARKDGVYDWV